MDGQTRLDLAAGALALAAIVGFAGWCFAHSSVVWEAHLDRAAEQRTHADERAVARKVRDARTGTTRRLVKLR